MVFKLKRSGDFCPCPGLNRLQWPRIFLTDHFCLILHLIKFKNSFCFNSASNIKMGKLLEVHKCEPNKTFWKSNSSYSRHLLSWMLLISKSCRTNLFMVPWLYFALYLEVFLRKSTIEKSILNKSLLFQTRQINNQLQDKVDQHLRQSVKQLTIENIFQKLMKLQRICTAIPSWKRQNL